MHRTDTKSELYIAPAFSVQEICIRSCIAASLSGSTEGMDSTTDGTWSSSL